MKTQELYEIAFAWLRARYPNALIVPEFSVSEYGGALVDLAAVLPDRIIGVELKGEGDSPTRLPRQGMMYGRVCRSMYLLASPNIADRCSKHRPPGWKELRVEDPKVYAWKRDGTLWRHKRWGDDTGYGLASIALAAMPWTKEYRAFGRWLGGASLPRTKAECIKSVAGHFPVREIEKAVCQVLRERNWEFKKVFPPDGSEKTADKNLFGDAA